MNDAPALTPSVPVLGSISEDDVNNVGYLVGDFRGAIARCRQRHQPRHRGHDLDPGNGHWEYSTQRRRHMDDRSAPSRTATLCCCVIQTALRFVPDGSNGTTAGFTYRGWDGSTGTAGTQSTPAIPAMLQPFSSAFDSATLTVGSVNDAPALADTNGTLASITENEVATNGHLVSTIADRSGHRCG